MNDKLLNENLQFDIKVKVSIKHAYYITILILALCAVFVFAWCYSTIFNSLSHNSLNDFADVSNFRISKYIISFKNPFSIEALNEDVPVITTFCPIVPLIAGLFSILLGGNFIASYYIVNILLLFFISFIIYKIFTKRCNNIYEKLILYLFVFLITCTFFTINSIPVFNFSSETILLLSIAILLYYLSDKNNNTNAISLVSAISIIISPLFIIHFISTLIYCIVVKRKPFLIYFLKTIVVIAVLSISIYFLLPTYFAETFVIHLAILLSNFKDVESYINLSSFIYRYLFIILPSVFGVLLYFLKEKLPFDNSLNKLNEEYPIFFYTLLDIIVTIIVLIVFANNPNYSMRLIYCMLAPSILVMFLNLFFAIASDKNRYLIIYLAIASFLVLNKFNYEDRVMLNSNEIYRLNKDIKNNFDKNILISDLIPLNRIYDETKLRNHVYCDDANLLNSLRLDYDLTIFPYAVDVTDATFDYKTRICDIINSLEYPLLVIPDDGLIGIEDLGENYEVLTQYNICSNNQSRIFKTYILKGLENTSEINK